MTEALLGFLCGRNQAKYWIILFYIQNNFYEDVPILSYKWEIKIHRNVKEFSEYINSLNILIS